MVRFQVASLHGEVRTTILESAFKKKMNHLWEARLVDCKYRQNFVDVGKDQIIGISFFGGLNLSSSVDILLDIAIPLFQFSHD